MSNKQFALFIVLFLSAFLGWIYYDSQKDAEAIRNQQVSRDLISGGNGGPGAAVQYIFRFPNPVYSHALNTQQIETLSQSGGGGGEQFHIYGLTQADYKLRTLYEVAGSKKWFKQEYSIWVENLQVEFIYNTVNVYVTRQYPEGSCEYQATLDHENQHVEIHRQVYLQYQKVLREALAAVKDIPLAAHPIMAGSWKEGKERISKIISESTDPVFDGFKTALEAEQAKIDNQESYAELHARCRNW